MARDVFISYRSEDKVWADRLCTALERQSITCWIAPRDISAGREWAEAIVDALQHCKSFVLVLSSNSLNARQISREAELADQQRVPIITFRVENVQPPPGLLYFLGNLQWLDAFDNNFDSAVARLSDVVKYAATQPAPMPPPSPASTALAPVPASGVSLRNIALGWAAVAVIGFVGWFVSARPKPDKVPNPLPGSASGARAEAEKFIDALKTSNYDEAWNQFTEEARSRDPKGRMIKVWTQLDQRYGPIQSYRFNRCVQGAADGIFTCLFKLDYRDGLTAEGRYIVARNAAGIWAISTPNRTEPKKAP